MPTAANSTFLARFGDISEEFGGYMAPIFLFGGAESRKNPWQDQLRP